MKTNQALIVLCAGAAVLLLLRQNNVPPEDAEDTPNYEPPDLLDQADAVLQDITDMTSSSSPWEDQNVSAFLWTIRVSEGTDVIDGYSMLVGGGRFDGFADHPRVLVQLSNLGIKSSAAGAYQILRRTWDDVRDKLGLPDFSPASQDAAAVELIKRRGALADVRAGRFNAAIDKCKKEWASLPGAGYGQHENSLTRLANAYTTAGGMLA
jgi:muramidase (phage lysozyme)